MQPTLNYLFIYSRGNDQRDVEVTSLTELLPYRLGVD